MQAPPKGRPSVIPIRPRPPAAQSASTPTAPSSTAAAALPPPPLREILPAPPTTTTATNQKALEPKPSSHTNVVSNEAAARPASLSVKPAPAAPAVPLPSTQDSMVVRRAAASTARLAVQKHAQFDNSDDDSDMDVSDSDDELTPFPDTRDSTVEPKASGSSNQLGSTKGKSTLKAVPLDMKTVRTSAPAVMPPRKAERLFGLEHCPIYYPTDAEFAQPLEYIERIAKQAREHEYGICKVVPPKGWQPPFSLDTEVSLYSPTAQLSGIRQGFRVVVRTSHRTKLYHLHRHSALLHACSSSTPWKLQQEPISISVNSLPYFIDSKSIARLPYLS